MLAALTLVVCLNAAPDDCRLIEFGVMQSDVDGHEMTMNECTMAGGQTVAANFVAQHPTYHVKSISCRPDTNTFESDA